MRGKTAPAQQGTLDQALEYFHVFEPTCRSSIAASPTASSIFSTLPRPLPSGHGYTTDIHLQDCLGCARRRVRRGH